MKLLLVALTVTGLMGLSACGNAKKDEEPIRNLNPVNQNVALAGRVNASGVETLKAEHYDAVVDLRTPEEGIETERNALEGSGIEYINIPVGHDSLSENTTKKFSDTMDRLEGKKVLVHCQSGNRAGMMWGVYQTGRGVPLDEVLRSVQHSVTNESLLESIKQHAAERKALDQAEPPVTAQNSPEPDTAANAAASDSP